MNRNRLVGASHIQHKPLEHAALMDLCCHPHFSANEVCKQHQGPLKQAAKRCLEAWNGSQVEEYGATLTEYVAAQRAFALEFAVNDEPYDTLLAFNEPELDFASLEVHMERLAATLPQLIAETLELVRRRGIAILPDVRVDEALMQLTHETGFRAAGGQLELAPTTYSAGTPEAAYVAIAPGKPEETLRAALHEMGHSRYLQSTRSDCSNLSTSMPVCSVIHEGSALLYEKIIGGSQAFCRRLPELLSISDYQEDLVVGIFLQDLLFLAATMTRISVEHALVSQIVKDVNLASLWSFSYKKYTGGMIPTYFRPSQFCPVEGTYGIFGYAPAYLLGMVFAAEVRLAKEEYVNRACDGNWESLNHWMDESFWKEGGTVASTKAQCLKVFDRGLDTETLVHFLQKRLNSLVTKT